MNGKTDKVGDIIQIQNAMNDERRLGDKKKNIWEMRTEQFMKKQRMKKSFQKLKHDSSNLKSL